MQQTFHSGHEASAHTDAQAGAKYHAVIAHGAKISGEFCTDGSVWKREFQRTGNKLDPWCLWLLRGVVGKGCHSAFTPYLGQEASLANDGFLGK